MYNIRPNVHGSTTYNKKKPKMNENKFTVTQKREKKNEHLKGIIFLMK